MSVIDLTSPDDHEFFIEEVSDGILKRRRIWNEAPAPRSPVAEQVEIYSGPADTVIPTTLRVAISPVRRMDVSLLEKRKRKAPKRFGVVPLSTVEDEIKELYRSEWKEIEKAKLQHKEPLPLVKSTILQDDDKDEIFSPPSSLKTTIGEDDEVSQVHIYALLALSRVSIKK